VPEEAHQEEPPAGVEEELPLAQLRELLTRLREGEQPELGWELGIHVGTLAEAAKEYGVRLRALEEENRALQERLAHGHQEYMRLRESMDELLDLHELSESISTSFKVEDILGALMDLSRRFVRYESCGVFVLDEEEEHLAAVARRGEVGRLEEWLQAQWEDGIVDWVLRERRTVAIEDMDTAEPQGEGRSFVIIPLLARGDQIGVYVLHCPRAKDEYTFGELEILEVLASQAAVAIENSRLYTDLETAHERLKESQRQVLISAKQAAVGELAGGVAHEVNNPLQIILSRVQLMTMQHRADQKVVDGLGLIENNVRRISRIIRALMGFARHRGAEEQRVRFDVEPAIQQACALVKHQLDTHLIEVSVNCADDLPGLLGNVGELEQVFINLILNAQNAMPRGGRLRVSARREGETVELRFADTGPGIPPEHLDRIFEPFFTTRHEEGGTGLGLAVSYRIIEVHQGTLTVESTLGEGATFVIRLPIEPPLNPQEPEGM
jgi:signal transduction histidine kinase